MAKREILGYEAYRRTLFMVHEDHDRQQRMANANEYGNCRGKSSDGAEMRACRMTTPIAMSPPYTTRAC
jgi:hypothetical protein